MSQEKNDKSKEKIRWEKFITDKPSQIYELSLIQKKMLFYERDNKKYTIFYGILTELKNDKSNINRLYYRHMTQNQFDFLLITNNISMVDKKAYVAITTNHKYCMKYFNGQKRNNHEITHIIEFYIHDINTNLEKIFKETAYQKLKIKNLTPKIEDGALSWGLGPQSRKGILGIVFNELLNQRKISWKIVNYKYKKKVL